MYYTEYKSSETCETHVIVHSAKRRSLTIDDDVDEMDPNLEEPLKAKMRREPRQGATY